MWFGIGVWLAAVAPCFGQPVAGVKQQVETHARQAQAFLRANKPDLAAREYEAIVALDPEDAEAQGNLGVLLFFNGNYGKAAPHLRVALKPGVPLPKIQALLGMSEKRIGQPAAARADLEQAFPQLQDEKLRRQTGLELVELYSGAGDLAKAAEVVNILQRIAPDDVEILYTSRRVYGALADDAMLRLTLVAPGSARMHQLMAHEMMRQGNRAGAIVQYQQALKIDPKVSGLHFELGEALRTSDTVDMSQAQKEYRAALELNPFDSESECRLGDLSFRGSDTPAALRHYTRCAELRPDDADANVGLAKTLMQMNERQKARQYLEHAVQLDPLHAVAHFRLASIYRAEGKTADADRELAEFRRLKTAKDQLREVYKLMHLQPSEKEQPDSDLPK